MAFSFRLDATTAAKLRRLAKQKGWTQSEVVREAVTVYGEPDAAPAGSGSILDRLRPYAGSVTSNGAQLSTRTHDNYRARLQEKRTRVARAR